MELQINADEVRLNELSEKIIGAAFEQLLIRKDERRLDNPLSAFICVHLRLKNIRNDFYNQHISAPICGFNPVHSANLQFIEPNRFISEGPLGDIRLLIESAKSNLTQTAKGTLVALYWSHFKDIKVRK